MPCTSAMKNLQLVWKLQNRVYTLGSLRSFFALAGAFETFLWFPATIIFFRSTSLYSIGSYTFKACVCSKCHKDSMIPFAIRKSPANYTMNEGSAAPDYIIEKQERTIYLRQLLLGLYYSYTYHYFSPIYAL